MQTKSLKNYLSIVFLEQKNDNAILCAMAEQAQPLKKNQLSLEEYLKIKEARAKSRLKLHFPMMVKVILFIPIVYFVFILVYFIVQIRFIAEH